MRAIIYKMKDGSEEAFPLRTVEDEQHERAAAEREVHSRDTYVAGYHFENDVEWDDPRLTH